ncbi:hypothetical protein II906_11385 [bacterium]|nr:hypothetical protein [bacterium]
MKISLFPNITKNNNIKRRNANSFPKVGIAAPLEKDTLIINSKSTQKTDNNGSIKTSLSDEREQKIQELERYISENSPWNRDEILSYLDNNWSPEEISNYIKNLAKGQDYGLAGINAKIGLSEEERRLKIAKLGLKHYQGSNYANMIIRSCKGDIQNTINVFRDMGENVIADFIENGYDILSYEVPETMTVCRYEYTREGYPIKYKTGDVFTQETFISTTTDMSDKSWAKNFVERSMKNDPKAEAIGNSHLVRFEIEIPKGSKIVTGNDAMGEVLIKYGSNFQVLDFDSDTNTYKTRLVA